VNGGAPIINGGAPIIKPGTPVTPPKAGEKIPTPPKEMPKGDKIGTLSPRPITGSALDITPTVGKSPF
jgi:hypothetical protein